MNIHTTRALILMATFCDWLTTNDDSFPEYRVECKGNESKLLANDTDVELVIITVNTENNMITGQTYKIRDPLTGLYSELESFNDACFQVTCWYGACVPKAFKQALGPEIQCSVSQMRNTNQLITCTHTVNKSHINVLYLNETDEYFWNNRFHKPEDLAVSIQAILVHV